MHFNPHLEFAGTCEKAFTTYAEVLGGRVSTMMRYRDAPTPMPDAGRGWGGKILHITMVVGPHLLTGADVPRANYRAPQGFSILLHVDPPSRAERAFRSLAKGGRVTMPLAETFWAKRFGMLVDRFGVPWTINCGNSA